MNPSATKLTSELLPIGERIRRSYEQHADRIAVSDPRRQLTYRQLQSRASAVARGLRKLGCRPGDRLVLIAPNTVEWVEVDHACYIGGFVRVAPITRLHPHEIHGIISDADPTVVVVDGAWLAEAVPGWLPEGIEHLVVIGAPVDGALPFEELVAQGSADNFEFGAHAAQDDQWIIYTSGSTGKPKGVRCTGLSLGAMTRNMLAEMPDMTSSDIALHTAPLSHFSGAVGLAVFAAGGCNVLRDSFQVHAVATAVTELGVTLLPMVPTQITMLTDYLLDQNRVGKSLDASGIHQIPYAGSAIAPDRLAKAQEVFGEVLLQFYGASEAPQPLTALQPKDHLVEATDGRLPRLASAGRVNRFVELKIVSPDGAELPPGETGEIVVAGPQVMPGYWRLPEATSEVLSADGWLRTGDVGYLDEDGFLFIVDRKKDMVITGGFNVYPREVENAISTLGGVREVAVVGAPSEKWGEELVAVVSLQPDADLTAEDVIGHCRSLIAGYKLPKKVTFVNELPKSGTGKILKRTVHDELWSGRARNV
ncbi:class I adenylate-forming enzyme family protein [Rhodococcus erythropolis]|uniref:class I adenylate-forming enzyme family protein n=1 Tax=Rhodococcus erythropolis TaxID=1833 RepID=UPI0037FCFB20